MRTFASGLLVATLGAGALAGCAPAPDSVNVFAAASLTDAFEVIAEEFEAANPGMHVALSFAGSSTLAAQVREGAPADVFASADPAHGGTEFAVNTLELAVPAGNPAGVDSIRDLADESLTIALCAREVPCGAAAHAVFERLGIVPAPDTLEQDVRGVLTKIELGEVDAGLVYRTDVRASRFVEGIPFPDAELVPVRYPIQALTSRGEAFVAWVLSGRGQAVLREAGFGAP